MDRIYRMNRIKERKNPENPAVGPVQKWSVYASTFLELNSPA
jgi:hypothetical protein